MGFPFLMVMTLTLAYGRIEVSVLGAWGRTVAAGSYHVVYQLILVVYSICGIFFTVVYPRLYSHRGDQVALVADFRDTARWLSLLTWFFAPQIWIFAEPILHMLGGAPLEKASSLLRILDILILVTPAAAALNFLLPLDMLRSRIAYDAIGVAVTAIGAAYAASTDRPDLAACAAVVGYALAIVLAHRRLHSVLLGSSAALLAEYGSAVWRAMPAVLVSLVCPGPWWLRGTIYTVTFVVTLVVTRHPAVDRILLRHLAS
jgi:O-antigen/teichoic acid export membrane protein